MSLKKNFYSKSPLGILDKSRGIISEKLDFGNHLSINRLECRRTTLPMTPTEKIVCDNQ
jgi:hypothetical protein